MARQTTSIAAGPNRDALLDAACRVLASKGWRGATLNAIADSAGVTAGQLVAQVGDIWAVLEAIGLRATAAALAEADAGGGSQAVRDRLFELIMARFDALQSHKDAVRALLPDRARDPALALFFALGLPRHIATLASAAGVATAGVTGALRVKALTALYLKVTRVWLRDATEDQAKTLAALDKALADAERWALRFERVAGFSLRAETATPSVETPGPTAAPAD